MQNETGLRFCSAMLKLLTTGSEVQKRINVVMSSIALVGLSLPAIAADQAASDSSVDVVAEQRKSAEKAPVFRTGKGVSHFLQKYSGINWLTNTMLTGVASTALSVKTRSLVKAKVRTYNFTDLLDGEFRSFDVKVNGGKFEGVPLGKLHAASNGPFKLRYFKRKGNSPGLVGAPLLVSLDGDVAEKEITRGLNSGKVAGALRFLKLDLPGLGEQRLQIVNPKVELIGDKVKVKSWLITAGASQETGILLEVIASPKLEQERFVVLKDMQVNSSALVESEHFSDFASELLNPLVDFGRMDRLTHAIRFQKLDIANQRVKFSGRLLLAPKPAKTPVAEAPKLH